MATKFTYDTANKLFILNAGVTSLDAKTEFYSAVKYDWLTDDNLNKFRFPIDSIGGQDIGGGNTISPYYSLKYGWRLQFAGADQTIVITGNVITTEGDSPLVDNPGMYHHVAQFTVSANSLTSTTTGGGTSLTAAEVWNLADGIETGLTPAEAVQILAAVAAGKTLINADNIKFRDINDTRDVVDADTDGAGQRLSLIHISEPTRQ